MVGDHRIEDRVVGLVGESLVERHGRREALGVEIDHVDGVAGRGEPGDGRCCTGVGVAVGARMGDDERARSSAVGETLFEQCLDGRPFDRR